MIVANQNKSNGNPMLTLLHTSDWHLGRRLYNQPRYDEFEQFLNWLLEQIEAHNVDILLVAGDIFDTSTPSTKAQTLYYQFLTKIARTPCRHVVITAGNHDSPSFLEAPQGLLKALDIHVIGSINERLDDEILLLKDETGTPEMLILAVPYLRDRDVRKSSFGDSLDDKVSKLNQGIEAHYQTITELALAQQAELEKQFNKKIPLIGSGHLFVTGGQTIDGDGVRELYVGGEQRVHSGIFSPSLDYVALGHLHVPQIVNQNENIRYSGSPIAMGFGEAKQTKQVMLVQFDDYKTPTLTALNVPIFQQLATIKGDFETIKAKISELKKAKTSVWLEVLYDGDEIISDFYQQVAKLVENSNIVILKSKNLRINAQSIASQVSDETLEDLDENEVFERCLVQNNVPDEQRAALWACYSQVLDEIHQAV